MTNHKRGDHSDDREDNEPCYCQENPMEQLKSSGYEADEKAKTAEQERDDIWKWIGENSWVQDSPTGEVRVIDVDELADYWRKQNRETQSKKN